MRREDHGHGLLGDCVHEGREELPRQRVEARERLIESSSPDLGQGETRATWACWPPDSWSTRR
jgi:hypothetical protein